ncbi:hypothetical protein WN48_06967 [Eufriesea mexicana]|uniref:Uncharacterized protein n=1 Tax=Eufriesea mexicana TaxID=516756 RepID=A0A310SYQ1_9HYME|nr:hypothetical protein WN48_06967 [Eufriesea mexicana]
MGHRIIWGLHMRGAAPKKTLPVVGEGEYSAFAGAVGVTDGDGGTSSSWEPPGKAAKRPRKADAEEPTSEMDVEELIPLPPGQVGKNLHGPYVRRLRYAAIRIDVGEGYRRQSDASRNEVVYRLEESIRSLLVDKEAL